MSKEYKRLIATMQVAKLTPEDHAVIRARQGDVCFYCGCGFGSGKAAPIFDHFIPRSKGGSHTIENRVAACTRCDGLKGNRLPYNDEIARLNSQLDTCDS